MQKFFLPFALLSKLHVLKHSIEQHEVQDYESGFKTYDAASADKSYTLF